MSFRSAGPAAAITAAIAWFGLALFAFLAVWHLSKDDLVWWVKIAAGLTGALAFIGYGIDAFSQEFTVHRWAISQFIFTTVGVVLVIAAILNSNVLGMSRGIMFAVAPLYLLAAAFCMAGSRDLF